MLLPQETMFNESSTNLQSDGRPVSSSVGDNTLSADNVKSDPHPSASPCLVKCLLQRLCSLFRPSKCTHPSNTHPTAEKQPASEPAGMTQADKVPAHSTTAQSDGPKNERAKAGSASSRPRYYKPIVADASSGPTRCKPPAQRASSGPREYHSQKKQADTCGSACKKIQRVSLRAYLISTFRPLMMFRPLTGAAMRWPEML
jgi:hypothetical protein